MTKKKNTYRFVALLSCLILFVWTLCPVSLPAERISAATETTIKIMPLGDSITDGDFWRTLLYNKLIENGYENFEFVGSNGNNEGHWGMRVMDLAASGQLVGWLDSANPDIVMMHFGTNDCFDDEKTTDQILEAYTTLVDEMRDNNPNMIILVAKIIPLASYHTVYNERVDALNARIDDWASSLTSEQSPITVVDQHTGFTDADIGDGVHPSSSGGQKMCDRWYEVLSVILSALQEETPATSEVPTTTEPIVTSETPITTEPIVTSETPITTEPVVTSETPITTEPVVTSEAPITTEPAVTSEAPVTSETPADDSSLQLDAEVNAWSGGYTMSVNITNTSTESVDTWKLVISKSDFTITNIWCADITETATTYEITPMSWNQSISVGGSINFGFQGTGAVPDSYDFQLV